MNLRTLSLLTVLAALPISGCVIVARSPGDVTFLWTFEGQGCSMVPAVKNVRIAIAGQAIANDGVFDCSTNGTAGIVLHDFVGKTYSYTIQGRDYNNAVLYEATGTFKVDGNVQVQVDLKAKGGGNFAYLVWTFPPNSVAQNPTCAQAGVDKVNVSIDGAQPVAYPCADGQTAAGTPTPMLTPGTHQIDLSAVDATGYEYYGLRSTLPISSSPTAQQYDLNWTVGSTVLRWQLQAGGFGTDCTSAGITDMYVNFRTAAMTFVYTGAGKKLACSAGAAGVSFDFLRPGTYAVFLQASGTGNTTYQSDQNNPPMVTVQAGVFPTSGPSVVVTRVP